MITPELEALARERLAAGIVRHAAAGMSDAERRELVERLAAEAVDQLVRQLVSRGEPTLAEPEEAALLQRLVAAQLGLGRLQLLLDDDSVENVNINGSDSVWVKYADGTKARAAPVADSDEELVGLVQRAARGLHSGGERRIDSGKPIVDLQLPGGHRLSAMIDVADRPAISVRRHRVLDPTLDGDFADAAGPELRRFLAAAVRARCSIVVAGPTDAGKTTLLRALCAEIDPAERLITIELAYELGRHLLAHRHPDCTAWEAREANTEGHGAIAMDLLVQRANRHDPDRIVVGEVLGDEIIPMLNAMSAGRSGLCTIHADDSEGAFGRMISYASQAPKHLAPETTARLVSQAVDLVVLVTPRPRGTRLPRRFVASVRAVEGVSGEHVVSAEIFRSPPEGGPAVAHHGLPPRLRDRLALEGYEHGLGILA